MDDYTKTKEELINELLDLRQRLTNHEDAPNQNGELGRSTDDFTIFRSFFDHSQDGMALVSEEGKFLEVNPAFSELLGYEHRELLGKKASIIWANPHDRSDWRTLMDEKGRVKDFEALMRKQDGDVIHCLITCTRIASCAGITQYQTILRDISEKKKAESQLKEAWELNKKIFSSSPIGIATYGPDGNCTSANEAAGALIGANLDRVLNQNFRQLKSWKESGLVQAAKITLHSGEQTQRIVRVATSFGKDVWLDCRFARFLSHDQLHLLLCFSDITELKQAEEESGTLFRKYFELGRIGMAITSPEKGWVKVNDQVCKMLGYSRQELTSMTWAELTYPDDLDPDIANFEMLMKGEIDGYSMEKRFIRKDRKILHAALHVGCIRDKDGKVENVIAHLEDISERKQSERGLQERVKELNCLYAVSKLTENSSMTVGEIAQGITDLIPAGWQYPEITRARIFLEDKEFKSKGFAEGVSKLAAEITENDKQIGTLEVHYLEARPMIEEDPFLKEERDLIEALASGFGAAIARKRMESNMIAEREQLLSVFDGIDDVIYVADPDTYELLYVNEAFRKIWGHEEIGKKCFRVLQDRTDPCPFCTNEKIFGEYLGRSYVWEFQNQIDRRWYRCSDKAIRWVDGRMVRFELASDITEQKATEEQLKKTLTQLDISNKELEHFAYVASHDLREPLRKISNFTGLLAKRYSGALDEKADNYIHYIVDGAERMQKLIEDLLLYSRIGRAEITSEPTNADHILQQTLSDLSPMLEESRTEVSHDPLPYVSMNPSQLSRLLQNLIGNAVKFRSDKAPKIHISAVREDDNWVFSVQDNGIGFDPKQSERIFGIFQRLHARGEFPGTGIGLAVCKKAVERHGGQIWAESEPGEGSTFYFRLPGN